MKIKIFIIIALLTSSSCSSLNKTLLYSAVTGSIVGGIAGKMLSPDRESNGFNTGLGLVAGAAVGAGVGYMLFKEDPDNRELKTMIDAPDMKRVNVIPFDVGVPISENYYKVKPDTSNLPDHLKDKVKMQVIREKKIPSRVQEGTNGKSIFVPETTVIEYDYE